MENTNIEKLVNEAMIKVGSQKGWEAMQTVAEFFSSKGHPHAQYTLEQEAMNRWMGEDDTANAAVELAAKMAYLVNVNEELK